MCTKFFTRPTNARERTNEILLLSDRNVSVSDVAGHLQGAITIIMYQKINPQLKVM
jgi:hypothetical protein